MLLLFTVCLLSNLSTIHATTNYTESQAGEVQLKCQTFQAKNVKWIKISSHHTEICMQFNETGEPDSCQNERWKILGNNQQSALHIMQLQLEDEGLYICKTPEDEQHFYLKVIKQTIPYTEFIGTVVGAVIASVVIIGLVSCLVWKNHKQIKNRFSADIRHRLFKKKSTISVTITPALSGSRLAINEHFHIRQSVSAQDKVGYDDDLEMEPLTDMDIVHEHDIDFSNTWYVPEHMEINIQEMLNHGFFGEIYVAHLKQYDNPRKVIVQYTNVSEKTKFLWELDIRKKITYHENIVEMHGYFWEKDSKQFGLVTEFFPCDTLKEYIDSDYNDFTGKDLLKYAFQISNGMAHIETFRIVIRDLTAANIVMGSNHVCKIGYFGLARDLKGKDEYIMTSDDAVPIRWLPPEALFENRYTLSTDVWSYGVVLWEIVTLGLCPYPELESPLEVMEYLKEGKRMSCPEHCNPEIYKLMWQCWEENPADRPSFMDIKEVLKEMLSEQKEKLNISNVKKAPTPAVSPQIHRHQLSEMEY